MKTTENLAHSEVASDYSKQLSEQIKEDILRKGAMTFAEFMQRALYTPGLGYYSAGSRKFGKDGDFVTAPEISSLFSRCLAAQCEQIIKEMPNSDLLEFGAGSGIMAADLLSELESRRSLPNHYFILEVSADLRERQQQLLQTRLPYYIKKIVWLDKLPEKFSGIIIANEVLDAMPVHRVQGQSEYYVNWASDKFCWQLDKPSSSPLEKALRSLRLPDFYCTEINLQLKGWLQALSVSIERGVVLILDYGFPEHEYYHPERSMGTLMCHYQHRAHDNPLIFVGMQDITAHVNFSAVADAGKSAGFNLAGYTSQAQFLLNCDIANLATAAMRDDRSRFEISQQLKQLTLPSEMGELFKVIALEKKYGHELIGFKQGGRKL